MPESGCHPGAVPAGSLHAHVVFWDGAGDAGGGRSMSDFFNYFP